MNDQLRQATRNQFKKAHQIARMAIEGMRRPKPPSEIICPVCGYYCTGKGGFGCIDKPGFQDKRGE